MSSISKSCSSEMEKFSIEEKASSGTQTPPVERQTWSKKREFILALVGYSVGLGNVWRFPYLCYKNGGGAFLIPYFLSVVFAGIPMFFLEVSLGQFTKQSAVKLWDKLLPSMKGIGYGSAVINFLFAMYYMVVMAWTALYLVHCFIPGPLPWTSCGDCGNVDSVVIINGVAYARSTKLYTVPMMTAKYMLLKHQATFKFGIAQALFFSMLISISFCAWIALNEIIGGTLLIAQTTWSVLITLRSMFRETIYQFRPKKSFGSLVCFIVYSHYVLRKSSGIEELGGLSHWPLIGCFVFSWIVIYFCVFKGVRSSGKAVYVSATLPYIMLIILLVRGLTLQGAGDGLLYFLKPNFTKLGEAQVWVEAGSQIFYSYGICFTVLITFGSYNPFNNDCYKQSVVLASTCSLTSILASFTIFSILGHMALVQSKDIAVVATQGPGLVFQVYPTGLSLLPYPRVWAIFFFVTLFMVGIDTQFCGVEGTIAVILEQFPWMEKGKYAREKATAVISLTFLVLGIPFLTNGGIFVFELFNLYACSGICLLFVTFFQSMAIGWIYGSDRYFDNVKTMIGYRPSIYFKYCYQYFTPLLTMMIFLFNCIKYNPLVLDGYVYPTWANILGWCLSFASIVCVPGYFIYHLSKCPGSFKQKLHSSVRPAVLPILPVSLTEKVEKI